MFCTRNVSVLGLLLAVPEWCWLWRDIDVNAPYRQARPLIGSNDVQQTIISSAFTRLFFLPTRFAKPSYRLKWR